jgi:ATP-binding cassette subfamily B (MDR/TAP) protein 1
MNLVRDGIGEKIGLFTSGISMFVAAIIVGFIRSWKLSLVMLSATFVSFLMTGFCGRNMRVNQIQAVGQYAIAGSLAEEVLSSARNVTAFGTQKQLQKKYNAFLTKASGFDFKAKFWLSSLIASALFVMNLQYALAFWQGNRFLRWGDVNVGQILTVVMASMVAGHSVQYIAPHLQAFGQAVAAGTKILNTIERESPVNPEEEKGHKPDNIIGDIEFKNVRHIYPSRLETTVLDDFNLKVPAGKMLALVGASGSGKSTIFGLLERFYLPVGGQVLLDGNNISELNLKWLRRQMAIVSQEPVLFSSTIYENIAHGLVGTEYEDVSLVKVSLDVLLI